MAITPLCRVETGVDNTAVMLKLEGHNPSGSIKDRMIGHLLVEAAAEGTLLHRHRRSEHWQQRRGAGSGRAPARTSLRGAAPGFGRVRDCPTNPGAWWQTGIATHRSGSRIRLFSGTAPRPGRVLLAQPVHQSARTPSVSPAWPTSCCTRRPPSTVLWPASVPAARCMGWDSRCCARRPPRHVRDAPAGFQRRPHTSPRCGRAFGR